MKGRAFRHAALLTVTLLLFLALEGSPAEAQGSLVGLESVTAPIEAAPRELVTLVYRMTNEAGEPLWLIPQVDLPQGWRLVIPPEPIELQHGEEASGLFSLLVPAAAEAGEYAIPLSLHEASGLQVEAASFLVRVRSLRAVRAILLEAPDHAVAGDTYEAFFSVQNAGNEPQELAFRVRENVGLPVTVEPEAAFLPVGAAVKVVVRAQVAEDLRRSLLHIVTLVASSTEAPGAVTSASATVELIPRTLPAQDRYHIFPLSLELEPEFSMDEGASLAWRLRGSGPMYERDPGRLTVYLSEGTSDLSYHWNTLDVTAGVQRFELSPLTETGVLDTGANLWLSGGPWDLGLYHRADSQGATGLRLAHRWASTGESLSFQALAQGQQPKDMYSLTVAKPIDTAWGVGAEFGVRSGDHPSAAIRMETSWALPPFGGVWSWEHRDAGYLDQSFGSERLDVISSLQIGSVGHLTLRWEDGREGTTVEGSRVQRLTATLSGRLGDVVGGVRWVQAQEEAATSTERRDRSLRAHALYSLPSIKGSSLLHVVEWSEVAETPTLDLASRSAAYRANLRLPFQDGSVTPYLGLESESRDRTMRWRAGLRLDQSLDGSTSIALLGELDGGSSPGHRLWGSVLDRLPSGATAALQADWRRPSEGEPELSVAFSYTFPLDLPIGRRSDVGTVSGRVVDEEGKGLSGLVVRVGGLAATTRTDGSFHFPAVPAGTVLVELSPIQLGPALITLPQTPLWVEVAEGGRVEQSFQVVRGATIQGQLHLQKAEGAGRQAGAVWGEGQEPPPDLLRGVVVELSNGEAAMRRVLDATGRFAFERVPPGNWTLTVLEETLRDAYRAEPAQLSIQLQPGSSQSVEITVLPRARRIQFIQEGVVEAPAAP